MVPDLNTVEIYFDVDRYLRSPWTTIDLINETMNPSNDEEYFD